MVDISLTLVTKCSVAVVIPCRTTPPYIKIAFSLHRGITNKTTTR